MRIFKTIRLPLNLTSHLLDTLPWLKIIHLVRDPRATLLSQRRVAMCTETLGGIYGCTRRHCISLENDIIEADRLSAKHPGRLLRVFYEDLAARPIDTSRKMVEFIGTTLTQQLKEYVYNITLAGNPDNGVIGTTRRNSSEHIDSWKAVMKSDFINVIEELCNYTLRRFSYSFTKQQSGV